LHTILISTLIEQIRIVVQMKLHFVKHFYTRSLLWIQLKLWYSKLFWWLQILNGMMK